MIILAFVVLLTGLVVAFFSRSVTARQVSNSNVNVTRANIFAKGAAETIIGDLKQEIAAGSTASIAATTTGQTITVYAPKSNTATAANTVMPAQVGTPLAATPADTAVSYPNLLKRSVYDKAFFDSSTNSNYSAVGSKRASKLPTYEASQNGRLISPARWNAPLLLPKPLANLKTDDVTPDGAKAPPSSTTISWSYAPEWILVSRDGTNPIIKDTALPASSTTPIKWTATAPSTVVGRYAYNIYHEGGLLDMNAAGYPYPSGTTPTANAPYSYFPNYKTGLPFADLTQLRDSSNVPYLSKEQIEQFVAWRNVASSGIASGSLLPGLSWTPEAKQNYYTLIGFNNSRGFLSPASTKLTASNLTDRMVTSRQSLIQMMTRTLASLNTDQATSPSVTERANAQNALQYLGTFSRDLDQPSFIPDPNREKIKGGTTSGGNDAQNNEDLVNPSFLSVRVANAAFKHTDDTPAVLGEPLVRKRFLLQRLAWLTYQGPSATRAKIPTSKPADNDLNYDLWTLKESGITQEFLDLGTSLNIQRYFGLTWDQGTNAWLYNVHNGAGTSAIKKLRGNATSPGIEEEIAKNVRTKDDPDFFELLQAGTNVGAVAKSNTTGPSVLYKVATQDFNRDTSVSAAIFQIGANMIDQFDGDGYPTKITWVFGGTPTQRMSFYGVEDLPYVYKVQAGFLKLREADPASGGTNVPKSAISNTGPATLKDMGMMMWIIQPQLWNPHDGNSNSANPQPTKFRIYANSNGAAPPSVYSINDTDNNATPAVPRTNSYQQVQGGTPTPPLFSAGVNGTGTPVPVKTTPATVGGYNRTAFSRTDTEMTFSVPFKNNTIFREPTLLAKTGLPSGSDLHMVDLTTFEGGLYTQIASSTGPTYVPVTANNGGFKAATPNPLRLAPGEPGYSTTVTGETFIGMVGGLFPVRWVIGTGSTATPAKIYTSWSSQVPSTAATCVTTFFVECQNPTTSSWLTYDQKDLPVSRGWLYTPMGTTAPGNGSNVNDQSSLIQLENTPTMIFDPRTSRWGSGISDHYADENHANVPGPQNYKGPAKGGWIDSGQMTLTTDRPDQNSGFGLYARPTTQSTGVWQSQQSTLNGIGWHVPVAENSFNRPGMMSQNNPYSGDDGLRFTDDKKGLTAGDPQFYADPDGVIRRAMGGMVGGDAQQGRAVPSTTVGLPLARATAYNSANAPGGAAAAARPTQSQSRPFILNRPFRSVGEIGYVFSGTPWRNLDLATPESGYAALLDVFTLTDTQDSKGMVAGRVNINTRHMPVLAAILSGAYKDDKDPTNTQLVDTAAGSGPVTNIVKMLWDRTTNTKDLDKGPLTNISQLVGRWDKKVPVSGAFTPTLPTTFNIDGSQSYTGFSKDLATLLPNVSDKNIGRFREAAIRPLAGAGSTRVWNLMIDVIAQTGRYPASVTNSRLFVVEGEQRLWVHVAIDRLTGDVIDMQTEVINE